MGAISSGGQEILIGVWVPTAISGLILLLRIYCKHVRQRGLWWDDAVISISWILLLAANIVQTIEIPLGFGKHIANVDPANKPILGLLDEVTATLTIFAAAWSKTAFAVTLLRILEGWAKKCVWFIAISMNVLMLAGVILGWAQCSPPDKLWDDEIAGTCLPRSIRSDYNIFSGVYAGIMDLCLAALPWTILPKLQMHTREKAGVGVAMSMGVLAGGAAFAKSAAITELATGDFTFFGAPLVIWGTVEIAVTIVGCSIPILRALLSDYKHSRYAKSKDEVGTSTRVTANMSRRGTIGGHSTRKTTQIQVSSDADSDRMILHNGAETGIMRTAEVMIEYSSRREEEYELSRLDKI